MTRAKPRASSATHLRRGRLRRCDRLLQRFQLRLEAVDRCLEGSQLGRAGTATSGAGGRRFAARGGGGGGSGRSTGSSRCGLASGGGGRGRGRGRGGGVRGVRRVGGLRRKNGEGCTELSSKRTKQQLRIRQAM